MIPIYKYYISVLRNILSHIIENKNPSLRDEVNPIIWTLIYSKFEGIDSCILQGLVLLILL